MHVCVQPTYFRSDVKVALRRCSVTARCPTGDAGRSTRTNLRSGNPCISAGCIRRPTPYRGRLSHITTFQRQGQPDPRPLEEGKLALERLEIARLDNDLNFPERGVFRLQLEGGK